MHRPGAFESQVLPLRSPNGCRESNPECPCLGFRVYGLGLLNSTSFYHEMPNVLQEGDSLLFLWLHDIFLKIAEVSLHGLRSVP